MTTRAAVVAEAMTWLGTPYHHSAWIKGKGGGVDCVYLLERVYQAVGLLENLSLAPYAPDRHLHSTDELYIQGLQAIGAISVDQGQPGDAVLIKYGRTMSHAGILVEPDVLIHAYLRRGVILTRLGEDPLVKKGGQLRELSFWTLKGLT